MRDETRLSRIVSRLRPDGECLRYLDTDRRPTIFIGGKRFQLYRYLYEFYYGPLGNLDLHHTCGNGWCVNLEHLEPVSRSDHRAYHRDQIRAAGLLGAKKQREKTHCPRGHEYTPENTYVCPRGWRQCKACRDGKS